MASSQAIQREIQPKSIDAKHNITSIGGNKSLQTYNIDLSKSIRINRICQGIQTSTELQTPEIHLT